MHVRGIAYLTKGITWVSFLVLDFAWTTLAAHVFSRRTVYILTQSHRRVLILTAKKGQWARAGKPSSEMKPFYLQFASSASFLLDAGRKHLRGCR